MIAHPVPGCTRGPKVFGIGFPRTGTTSLVKALDLLGIRSVHNPTPLLTNLDDPILDAYDGFADTPIPLLYRQLDERLPGSRFIFTDRDVDEWLASVRWMIEAGRKHGRWDESSDIVAMHRALYGSNEFDEDLFRDRFLRHRADVLAYFDQRRADMLVMDVTRGDGWEQLCSFLGCPTPRRAFPHDNRRGAQWVARMEWRLRRALRALSGRASRSV